MDRRLAAILLTDMVGYSRLMGLDEEGTIARQKAHRDEVFDPRIAQHGGRIVKTTGDGLLVEFPSVVDAVRCAVELQKELAGRDTDVPEDRRIAYRIGINLGDIVIDGDDILGDGVNVAARLEGLANPGGICISGTVYDHVAGKIDHALDFLGKRNLKGFPEPVRVYAVQFADRSSAVIEVRPEAAPSVAVGELSLGEQVKGANGPMVAVLPFQNLSQDPDQEFFTDGLTQDIIHGLTASRSFQVLAGSATFRFKGRAVDPQTAGEELGAQYVFAGSLRRAGNRLRVSVELFNVETKLLLWAERYDRSLEDVFDIQDEITTTAVAMVEPEIDAHEMRRFLVNQHPANMNAYELAQRGLWYLGRRSPDGYQSSLNMFEASKDADPNYVRAYAGMAQAKYTAGLRLWGLEDDGAGQKTSLRNAIESGRMALDLDQQDPRALRYFGSAQALLGHYDVGLPALQRAITVHPSYATAYSALGYALMLVGDFQGAINAVETTERLRPGDVNLGVCVMAKAVGRYQSGDYEAAALISRQSRAMNDQFWFSKVMLTAALGQLGDVSQASASTAELTRTMREISADNLFSLLPFKDRAHVEHIIEGLRKAGLPG